MRILSKGFLGMSEKKIMNKKIGETGRCCATERFKGVRSLTFILGRML